MPEIAGALGSSLDFLETLGASLVVNPERMKANAEVEAREVLEHANAEAADVRAEAAAIRGAAEERAKEVERIESEFNTTLGDITKRLGIEDKIPKEKLYETIMEVFINKIKSVK